MKNLIILLLLLSPASLFAQSEGDQRVNDTTKAPQVFDGTRWRTDYTALARQLEDVTALLAYEAEDGQLATTRGYLSAGIGGNTYRYDDDDTSTIDGGFVLPGFEGALSFDGSGDFDGTAGTGRWLAIDTSRAIASEFGVPSSGDALLTLQRTMDSAGVGGTVVIDIACTISDGIVPLEGQTVEWRETMTLDDGGSEIVRMVSVSVPNITLLNPLLDMDSDNNTSDETPGTQAAISNYGTGTNLRIVGGLIVNCIDNAYQGGRDGLVIDGLRVDGVGEHAIYINGVDANGSGQHADGLLLKNLVIDNVAVSAEHSEGHAIQARNCLNLTVSELHFDLGASPASSSFAFLLDNVQGAQIRGGYALRGNHRHFFFTSDCNDILVDGFSGTRVSNGPTLHTNGATNCRFVNCTFTNSTLGEDSPQLFQNCSWVGMTSYHNPDTYTMFHQCKFYWSSGSQFVNMQNAACDFIECEFYGAPVTGVYYDGPANESIKMVRNIFYDMTSDRAIWFSAGRDHQIVGNVIKLGTSSQMINVNSGVTGTVVVRDNLCESVVTGDGISLDDGPEYVTSIPAGVRYASYTDISDDQTEANEGRYPGKPIWDTTNGRMLFSDGATTTSDWVLVDGTFVVTPTH